VATARRDPPRLDAAAPSGAEVARPDLAALLADPARIADVPAAELPALVLRLAALQSAVAARLVQEVKHASPEPPLTAQEAARRLNVGVDWIREHGAAKGIEIRLSAGTVRYDPDGVERLRNASLTALLR